MDAKLVKKTVKMLKDLPYQNEEKVTLDDNWMFQFYDEAPYFGRRYYVPGVHVYHPNHKFPETLYVSLTTKDDLNDFVQRAFEKFFDSYGEIKEILEKKRNKEKEFVDKHVVT